MKKSLIKVLVLVMLVTCIPFSSFASDNITVTLDGQQIYFDVQPQIINGRTMVPMRAIFEAFGMNVQWIPEYKTVYATDGTNEIAMAIGMINMAVNENDYILDTPPQIIDGRTLVPVRAIAEALNANVNWDSNNRKVIINTTQKDELAATIIDVLKGNESANWNSKDVFTIDESIVKMKKMKRK